MIYLSIDSCLYSLLKTSLNKDPKQFDLLNTGKSNFSVQDKTISIIYGGDFTNLQVINFVALTENPVEVAKVIIKLFNQVILFCVRITSFYSMQEMDGIHFRSGDESTNA